MVSRSQISRPAAISAAQNLTNSPRVPRVVPEKLPRHSHASLLTCLPPLID